VNVGLQPLILAANNQRHFAVRFEISPARNYREPRLRRAGPAHSILFSSSKRALISTTAVNLFASFTRLNQRLRYRRILAGAIETYLIASTFGSFAAASIKLCNRSVCRVWMMKQNVLLLYGVNTCFFLLSGGRQPSFGSACLASSGLSKTVRVASSRLRPESHPSRRTSSSSMRSDSVKLSDCRLRHCLRTSRRTALPKRPLAVATPLFFQRRSDALSSLISTSASRVTRNK